METTTKKLTSRRIMDSTQRPMPVIYPLTKSTTAPTTTENSQNFLEITTSSTNNFSDALSTVSTNPTIKIQKLNSLTSIFGSNWPEKQEHSSTNHNLSTTTSISSSKAPDLGPNTDDVVTTSLRSTNKRTSKQTTMMLSDRTTKMNYEENFTFPPKPSFFKATIERVTIKPAINSTYIKRQTVSAAIPSKSSAMKIQTSFDEFSPYSMEPPVIVGDLFQNTPSKKYEKQPLVLYDTGYVKWLFDVFYRELKNQDLKESVDFKKVRNVFLNMLAEVGSVRSKWLNKSMAKHYATHFQRREYDNRKRYTLESDDLDHATEYINGLLAKYFDIEEDVPNLTPLTFSPMIKDGNIMYSDMNSVQNLPLTFLTPANPSSNDNTRKREPENNSLNQWIPWARVQSIEPDNLAYGGVSRNSGALPTIVYKNSTDSVNHKMQEYSSTKNAIARDIRMLFESIFLKNKLGHESTTSNKNSSVLSDSLNMENLPKEISQLVLDTIKRSKL